MKTKSTEADIAAPAYSRFVSEATRGYSAYLAARIAEVRQPYGGRRVSMLDIGSGTGNLLIELAGRPLFSGDELVGGDFSEAMVREAAGNAAAAGVSGKVRFELMDVHAMPVADGAFDLIVGRSIVHHWQNPAGAFAEIYRALAPGGTVLINEPSRTPSPRALEEFNGRRAALGCIEMQLHDKYTPAETEQFLRAAGIENFYVSAGDGELSLGYEICIQKKK